MNLGRMAKTEIEPINSYYRLLVHRVARFYGLEHVLDPQRSTVMILSKTAQTQMYYHVVKPISY